MPGDAQGRAPLPIDGRRRRRILSHAFARASGPDRGGAGAGRAASARAGKLIPATLRPVLDGLIEALVEVRTDDLDPRRAQALASLASAIVRVYTAGTLEERIAALEAAQAQQERQGA